MSIAVITARGGSKRIPRKNIKPFCGRPMISYIIETAKAANCFAHIVVSTDDEEIANIARSYGASTPFRRSADLAGDFIGTGPVMIDAVHQLEALGIKADTYCCLYPTAPLITCNDLTIAREQLINSDAPFVFSVGNYGHPIQRALRMSSAGEVKPFEPANMAKRSQDLEPAFHDAGQFYWGTYDAWIGKANVFAGQSRGYVLPRHRLVDIDTEEDWLLAESLFNAVRSGPPRS